MICFYHSADLDGHCSGAIMALANPGCELYPIDYGDEFPWEKLEEHDDVAMADFSLQPPEDMDRLFHSVKGKFTWIDHHKTAIDWYEENKVELHGSSDYVVVLENGKAACELAWEHYFSDNLPIAVYYLGRYDVWDHEKSDKIMPFQYGMRLIETDPRSVMDMWRRLLDAHVWTEDMRVAYVNQIISDGTIVLRYENQQSELYAKVYSFEARLGDLRCIVLNRGMTNSKAFDSVWDPDKHDAMLLFTSRGTHYKFSLYTTKDDVDVSAVAKHLGGGGHAKAAGFTSTYLPFVVPGDDRSVRGIV